MRISLLHIFIKKKVGEPRSKKIIIGQNQKNDKFPVFDFFYFFNIPKNLKQYLKQLRQICDQNKWLLIFDEVQCGIGRTGKWFAHQHSAIKPDIITLAKGLGSGIPIGACIANQTATELMKPGKHGSTFGGNPLACSAGIVTIDTIEKKYLIKNALKQGLLITNLIKKKFKNHPLLEKYSAA